MVLCGGCGRGGLVAGLGVGLATRVINHLGARTAVLVPGLHSAQPPLVTNIDNHYYTFCIKISTFKNLFLLGRNLNGTLKNCNSLEENKQNTKKM